MAKEASAHSVPCDIFRNKAIKVQTIKYHVSQLYGKRMKLFDFELNRILVSHTSSVCWYSLNQSLTFDYIIRNGDVSIFKILDTFLLVQISSVI